ncbi:MAG: ABC transporter permease [Planctomycetes bacterium]|nr:ABC transporter permease [Planctomycetota bacterium]
MLWHLSRRLSAGRRGRVLLTLFSVIIGVGTMVATQVAITTTRRSYEAMSHAMSGRADLEITSGVGQGIDIGLAEVAAKQRGVVAVTPAISRASQLYFEKEKAKLLVLGVEPDSLAAKQDYELHGGQFFDQGEGAVVDRNFARSLGIKLDDEIKFLTGLRGMQRVKVVGLMAPSGAASLMRGGTVLLPLPLAQKMFGLGRKVDVLQLELDPHASAEQVIASLTPQLPAGVVIRKPAARTSLGEETLQSSEQGLSFAGGLALILSVFIILNTFMMSVTERRGQIAVMRAIGATRRQTMNLMLLEATTLGIVGSLLGLLFGLFGAYWITRAMERVLQAQLPALVVSYDRLALAVMLGICLSLLSAWWPGWRASRVSPLEGLGQSPAGEWPGLPKLLASLGLVALLIGSTLLTLAILRILPIEFAVPGGCAALIGLVLAIPSCLRPLSGVISWLPRQIRPVETQMALGQLLLHPIRAMLTVGTVFLALAAGIALGTTILNSTRDIDNWVDKLLVADFWVRAMMPDMATASAADVPAEVGQELRQVEGIEHVGTMRYVSMRVSNQPAMLIAKPVGPQDRLPLDLKAISEAEAEQKLLAGEVILGTALAQRVGKKVGDQVQLDTTSGPRDFRVAAVTNDYFAGGLTVYMERQIAEKALGISGVNAFVVRVKPGQAATVEKQLRAICDKHGLMLQSAAEVRQLVDGMKLGIVGGLWGLLALTLVVAAIGIVNTLTMNVLEQTRELALMRIVAMTRGQMRATILMQAAMLGLIALVPGTAVGALLAWIMHLGATSEFGHTMAFSPQPGLMAILLAAAALTVVISSLFPAERAARLNLLTAIHWE